MRARRERSRSLSVPLDDPHTADRYHPDGWERLAAQWVMDASATGRQTPPGELIV